MQNLDNNMDTCRPSSEYFKGVRALAGKIGAGLQ